MNKLLIVSFLVTLIPFGVMCDDKSNIEPRRSSPVQVLTELTEKSIPFLNMQQYMRYGMKKDNNYDVITIFTIKNTMGSRCVMCDQGFKSLKLLGRALRKKEHPIFVVAVDIESERQLAMLLNIERMPLVHIRSKIHNLDEFYPMSQFLEVKLLQRWILMKTGVEVKLKVPTDYKKYVQMTITTLILCGLIYLAYKFLRKYIGKNLFGIAAVYFCVLFCAGFKYININNSSFMLKNAEGGFEFLGKGQQDQTVAECYLMVALNIAMVVCFLILTEIKSVSNWKIFGNFISLNKRRWILTLLTLYWIFYIYSYIVLLMQLKSGASYPYTFMLITK